MPQLTGRRPRNGRATSLKAVSMWAQVVASLKDRAILLRLGVTLLAIVGFMFAVGAWEPIFPHRSGDRVNRGIVARVDFKEVNEERTIQARRDAEQLVPYVFRHDPAPLSGLAARLRTHLGDVASADSLPDLSREARSAFGLNQAPSTADATPATDSPEKRFLELRSAVAGDMVGMELDQIRDDFDRFLDALRNYGTVDLETIRKEPMIGGVNERVASDHAIEIEVDGVPGNITATLSDVLLSEANEDTGRLGTHWDESSRLSAIKPYLKEWMANELSATLVFDAETTQERRRLARDEVADLVDSFPAGTILVTKGTVLGENEVNRLRLEHNAVVASMPIKYRILRGGMAFLMFAVLILLFGLYLHRSEPRLVTSLSHLTVFLLTCLLTVWIARLISVDGIRAELVPLLVTVMVLAIAYDQVLATLTGFALSIMITLCTIGTVEHFMTLMVISVVAVAPLKGVSSRSSLIKTGSLVAGFYFVVSWALGVIQQGSDVHPGDWGLLSNSLFGAFLCLLCSFLVSGILPFIESQFGIVTDLTLLELSDVSHPLLQELVRRAPGTYNHSIAVATIGEAAAEAIGANGLLVRVGAYYHDIGKMMKPEYFIENAAAGDTNRHDSLAPAMSTLIIIGHVKDGVSLAEEHGLPPQLVDFIEQHHGTTLVEYFYHEATRKADEDHKSEAEEASFRYPGPKPQTKEAGIMMLTDAVESASRTLREPTPKRIGNLVHEITMKRLHDGQFDECEMTLAEIHTVEDSLTKSLIAMHHGRIKYPEQRSA